METPRERQVSVKSAQALEMLKRGATIGNGPQGAWIQDRDGTSYRLHFSSFWSLGRRGLLRRVEPRGEFRAVLHYTYRPKSTPPAHHAQGIKHNEP
jgi:hypothetical protein